MFFENKTIFSKVYLNEITSYNKILIGFNNFKIRGMLMKIISINLPENDLEILERFLSQGRFPSRSEAIRSAVREFIKTELQIEKKEKDFIEKGEYRPKESTKNSFFDSLKNLQVSNLFTPKYHYFKESATPIFNQLKQSFPMKKEAIKLTWKIYADTIHQNILPKRSTKEIISASYYVSSRIIKTTILIPDIAELMDLSERALRSAILRISLKILFPHNIRISSISEKELAYKFCKDLSLPISFAEKALSILKKIRNVDKDFEKEGNISFIAASIYIVSQNLEEKRSQAQIANLARISTVTLRDRIKKIESVPEYDDISAEVFSMQNQNLNSYTRKFFKKMKEEGKILTKKAQDKEKCKRLISKLDHLIQDNDLNSHEKTLLKSFKEMLDKKKGKQKK